MHESMEDFMTIILGVGDPEEPGMHGPLKEPCPTDDAIGLVTKIRDMCDEWLRSAGKGADNPKDDAPTTEVGSMNDKDDGMNDKDDGMNDKDDEE